MKKCIGFGDNQNKCNNNAGKDLRGPLWCKECNDKRIAHIDKQLKILHKNFQSKE